MPITFLLADQSSPNCFRPMGDGCSRSVALFRFSLCSLVPDIFAIKVESCQKLDVFCPPQILFGAALPNVVPPLSRRVEKFHEVTPTSPKIVGAKTLNFKPNFKCSPLIFLGTAVLDWVVR